MTTLRVYLKWPGYSTSIQMDNVGLSLKKCSFMVSHFKMLWSVSRTCYGEVALSSPMPWAKRASLYNHNRYSYCIFWPILAQLGPILAHFVTGVGSSNMSFSSHQTLKLSIPSPQNNQFGWRSFLQSVTKDKSTSTYLIQLVRSIFPDVFLLPYKALLWAP